MPFPWYHPDVPIEYAAASEKAHRMYLQELKERAALLLRLGYSKADAKRRLTGNVRWDFELHRTPPHLGDVEDVVDAVYFARGLGAGGPPSLEL